MWGLRNWWNERAKLPSCYIFIFQAFSNLKARKGKYSKEVPIKTENNIFQFGDFKKAK